MAWLWLVQLLELSEYAAGSFSGKIMLDPLVVAVIVFGVFHFVFKHEDVVIPILASAVLAAFAYGASEVTLAVILVGGIVGWTLLVPFSRKPRA
jgi:hypothetical protein